MTAGVAESEKTFVSNTGWPAFGRRVTGSGRGVVLYQMVILGRDSPGNAVLEPRMVLRQWPGTGLDSLSWGCGAGEGAQEQR